MARAVRLCAALLLSRATATPEKRRLATKFKRWRAARLGAGGWCYFRTSGVLTDPGSGAVIARVEGVECARALPQRGGDKNPEYLVAPRTYRVARRYAYADADGGGPRGDVAAPSRRHRFARGAGVCS